MNVMWIKRGCRGPTRRPALQGVVLLNLAMVSGLNYYTMRRLHRARPTFLAQFRSDMEKRKRSTQNERNNESMHSLLLGHSNSL